MWYKVNKYNASVNKYRKAKKWLKLTIKKAKWEKVK